MKEDLRVMLSSKGEISTMRVLTTLCILNAILIGLIGVIMSLYVVIMDKPTSFDLTPFIALCGVFLSPLIPKSVQKFAERSTEEEK